MTLYLLDTNICIYYMKGQHDLQNKFRIKGSRRQNYFISEITLAELKFGVAKSEQQEKNKATLDSFLLDKTILPISDALDVYAEEKARLQKTGITIEEFDLLIGATAVHHDIALVTNNTRHFEKIKNIKLENWVASFNAD